MMEHEQITDELREQLGLYVLDLLDAAERNIIARHLEQGCPDCEAELRDIQETLTALAYTVPLVQPPYSLRDRVVALANNGQAPNQIWKVWDDAASENDLLVIRQDEGEWQVVAPGVKARRLYVDREHDRVTMMIRMDPGAKYGAHRHAAPEQCLVLEGDLFDGEQRYHAGDFQCKARGSIHDVQSTEGGCLLLIVCSQHDELLGTE